MIQINVMQINNNEKYDNTVKLGIRNFLFTLYLAIKYIHDVNNKIIENTPNTPLKI